MKNRQVLRVTLSVYIVISLPPDSFTDNLFKLRVSFYNNIKDYVIRCLNFPAPFENYLIGSDLLLLPCLCFLLSSTILAPMSFIHIRIASMTNP
jgi:hypothetical protein